VIYAKARPAVQPARPAPAERVAPAFPAPEAFPGFGIDAPPVPAPRADVVGDARGLASLARPPAAWAGGADAALHELRVQLLAPPLALLGVWALVSTGPGQALVRTFLSMWVHELGHAVAAWLCGRAAIPGPWRTWSSDHRQALVILGLAAGFGALVWLGRRTRRPAAAWAGAAGLAVQLVCTILPDSTARAFITFSGDGGALVLGAALVGTIWAGPEGRLGRGSLRWGFLVIGAAAVVDVLRQWVIAWRDPGELPLGQIEGVGLSDASRLVEVHGWAPAALSRAYVLLGLVCLAALAAGYALAVARARARVSTALAEVRRQASGSAPAPPW
jgi:hypothetical protein